MFPTFIMVDSCDKQRLCNMNVMNGPGIPEWSRNTSHVLILVFCYVYLPGPALSQLHQLLSIGPRAGNIYSRCSGTHNNTLQVLQRPIGPRTSYNRACCLRIPFSFFAIYLHFSLNFEPRNIQIQMLF